MKQYKEALITGITGQDGTYLTKFLLSKGYKVYGLITGLPGRDNFANFPKLGITESEISKVKFEDVASLITDGMEIYNFAAQSSVGKSWEDPETTFEVNVNRYVKLLETCKGKNVKVLQASSVEMFGDKSGVMIHEDTPCDPGNPYALSKYAAYRYGQIIRESSDAWITNAILSNHESPLRDEKFVTRKVIEGAKKIKEGKLDQIELGTIDILRDWGFAEEYVEIMWTLLQKENPMDIIVATGKTISLREYVHAVLDYFGINDNNLEKLVKINEKLARSNDIKSIMLDTGHLNTLGIKSKSVIEDIGRLIKE